MKAVELTFEAVLTIAPIVCLLTSAEILNTSDSVLCSYISYVFCLAWVKTGNTVYLADSNIGLTVYLAVWMRGVIV